MRTLLCWCDECKSRSIGARDVRYRVAWLMSAGIEIEVQVQIKD